MTAAAVDDTWMETCLIAISALDGSDIQFAGLTKTIDPDLGEKDIDGEELVNGGRVTTFTPEGMSTLTLEAAPLEAGTDTGTTGKGFFDLLHTVDATVPIRVVNDRTRTKHRVLVLWTNDSTATTAQSITAANSSAMRIGMANAYITSAKPKFSDGKMSWTIVIKCTAFDKAANANVMVESCAGSTADDKLPAIASYTSSCKFD